VNGFKERRGGEKISYTKNDEKVHRELTASQAPRSSKTFRTSKNVDAARNFLAVVRVATPRLSSSSAEAKTLKAKFSMYAEAALSTEMASEEPIEERKFSREVRRDARKERFDALAALREMPTWAA